MYCTKSLMLARRNGFTLIEIICVLVLLSLLGLFGTQMLTTAVRGYTNARNTDEVVQKAQMALQRMTVEFSYIALAGMSGTASSIQYNININGVNETHMVSQNGNRLLYQQGGANYTLLDGVSAGSLGFTYSNAYANAGVNNTTNNASITIVGISFTMQGDDPSLGLSKAFSTRVKINKN